MAWSAIRAGLFGWAALAAIMPGAARSAEPVGVTVTIKPIHSLAAAVMEGVGTPDLLIKGAGSAHAYALRPSDARLISKADLIVRVSERLESFLEKPIASLSQKATIVTLSDIPGIRLLPPREGGMFETHSHGHEEDHPHGKAGNGHDQHASEDEHDPHLWLNPANAAVIADHLAALLAEARPQQGHIFKENAARLKERLSALDTKLRAAVAPLKGKDFIVFHDAYHYFEDSYGIEAVGSITLSPERQPGAARLKAIRARIAASASTCVFSEPQFEPKLVSMLTEGTSAKAGILDPLGADLPEGPEHYFQLMEKLAADLAECLG